MKLAFKFRYEHDNGLFVRLLNRLQTKNTLPLYLSRNGAWHVLEAEGEQPELEALAEKMAVQIPLSLFLKEHKIEAIEEITGSSEPIDDPCDLFSKVTLDVINFHFGVFHYIMEKC